MPTAATASEAEADTVGTWCCPKLGLKLEAEPERARTFSPTRWMPATIALPADEAMFPALFKLPVTMFSSERE